MLSRSLIKGIGKYNFAKHEQIKKRIRLGRPGTSLKMGLLGMANIGKSSTFNILSNLNVPAQNIPFCTIQPNTAYIEIQDKNFNDLCKLYNPAKQVGKILRIVDIAGLVKGASQGFGLGNQFLSNIAQVDGLYHVVRAFPGQNFAHTEGSMDSVRDIKIIKQQLIQKDKQSLSKKLNQYAKKASKTQDKNIKLQYQVLKKVDSLFKAKKQIRNEQWSNQEIQVLNKYLFLTSKPMIYLLNTSQKFYLEDTIPNYEKIVDEVTENGKFQTKVIKYSIEYEQNRLFNIQQLAQDQKAVTQQTLPRFKTEVKKIIESAYEELELSHFYTVGKDEVRAWAIRTGETAHQAGGKIHSDFKTAFINAEVLHSDVLIKNPTLAQKLQKNSKKEGKGYIVKDGDILHFNCKIK